MNKQLCVHCYNCEHCTEKLAYEKCETHNRIIYNGNVAKLCSHYKQKEVQNE